MRPAAARASSANFRRRISNEVDALSDCVSSHTKQYRGLSGRSRPLFLDPHSLEFFRRLSLFCRLLHCHELAALLAALGPCGGAAERGFHLRSLLHCTLAGIVAFRLVDCHSVVSLTAAGKARNRAKGSNGGTENAYGRGSNQDRVAMVFSLPLPCRTTFGCSLQRQ